MQTNSRKSSLGETTKEELTRTAILDAALRQFQRFGLRKTTLEDIATAMGKKKSFLYYYFESKDAILAAVMQREMDAITSHTRSLVESQTTPQDKLRAFFTAPLLQILDRIRTFGQIIEEIRNDGEEFGKMTNLRNALIRREEALFLAILEEGIAQGVFRPMDEAVRRSLAGFSIAAIRGIEMGMVWGVMQDNSLAHIDEVSSVLIRGLMA